MKHFIKHFLLLLALLLSPIGCFSQLLEPVKWNCDIKDNGDEKILLFHAQVDKGWHLYDIELPEGGPLATHFTIEGAELLGNIATDVAPHKEWDEQFGMVLNWFEGEVCFSQHIKVEDANNVKAWVEFMACNDENCLPPTRVDFNLGNNNTNNDNVSIESNSDVLWIPVINELKNYGQNSGDNGKRSLWWIFFEGILGGLLALLTPCVWPIIPMTVSFFIKRTKDRRKGIVDAILYGLSIVVIYLLLGVIVTLIFGASALNNLATNAVFNIFFFVLLVVFAASFFGAFELTLPSSWSTHLDAKSERTTGILSILLMASTLVIVSFSCTGPIIGTLLVDISVKGSLLSPIVGMGGFALALALPFSLFALFPSWLRSLPKSGGWLNSVKVVLGFLELAFSLKFLSVADLSYGWHLLDRETFIVLWVVIFGLLGFYLLGKIKFSHDSDLDRVSVPRFFGALVSLAFAIYLIPGLWGAPLKAVSAFAPPMYTQDFNVNGNLNNAKFDNYEKGMAYGKQVGKPILVDFSGYGCVNCRKMEAAVWSDPRVSNLIDDKLVLVSLMVDDRSQLAEPMEVIENGKRVIFRTIGERNSYLQRYKFGANAQPFYVLLDEEGRPLTDAFSFSENPNEFADWLQEGINNYNR